MKIVLWSGTDIDYRNNDRVKKFMSEIINLKDIYHIANSKCITNDLKYFKLRYKSLPVCGIDITKYKPVIKGKKIYIYTSATRSSIYGREIYEDVMKKLPQFEFVLAVNENSYKDAIKHGNMNPRIICCKSNRMIKLYSQCFIGLRLTKHDGIAYTVLELGLCGIRCVHNGNQPNAINYKNTDDIVKAILLESKNIGKQHKTLHKNMKDWLTIKKNWTNTEFYKKIK